MSDTIVLITGANQGLGFEIAKKLVAENEHYQIILGSRDLQKGQHAVSELTKFATGSKVDALELDVTSDDSIEAASTEVTTKYGRLDVLMNNAGIAPSDDLSDLKKQRQIMHQIYDVNVAGVLAVTESFLPLLKKSSKPRIVIMSSDVGSIANVSNPQWPSYGYQEFGYKASKAAVNMVGAIYAEKYKKDGIRVNLVNPGFRATNLNNYSEFAGPREDGAIEACKYITMGNVGETGTYTELEGPIDW